MSVAGTQSLYLDNLSLLPAQTLSPPRKPAHSAANQWRAPPLSIGRRHLKLTVSKTELVLFKPGSIWVPLTECPHHLSTLQSQKSQSYSRFFFCLPDLNTKPLPSPLEFTYSTVTPSVSSSLFYHQPPSNWSNSLLVGLLALQPMSVLSQSPFFKGQSNHIILLCRAF